MKKRNLFSMDFIFFQFKNIKLWVLCYDLLFSIMTNKSVQNLLSIKSEVKQRAGCNGGWFKCALKQKLFTHNIF